MSILSSFRAQMVFFVAAMVLLTTVALQFINQQLERRITITAEEQFNDVNRAIDLAVNSFPSNQYLYEIVEEENLSFTPQSTVQNIFIVNQEGDVINSTNKEDMDSQMRPEIANLPPIRHNESLITTVGTAPASKIQFPIQTERGKRNVILVVSLQRLSQAVSSVGRIRLVATITLGLVLLILTALISRRFTQPVTELARAAQRVTAGDLDFAVKATERNEVGTLSRTFNEMIVGLRRNRELEEQLQRAERSAVVGRLASGIAHEIRNPLNFMNLSIDHLQTRFITPPKSETDAEATRKEATHILGLIKDEIARLNRLVSDFLSYGRPAKIKIKDIDSRALLEEVAGLVHTQAEQQGVKIHLEVPADASAHFEADAEQIKTCFSNLVINAVQAMPQGGELNLVVTQPEPQTGSMIKFEVRDTGIGIEADPLEQIFEPYYSTKDTGIGLGLPLTKKLIEDHGGEIKVSSEKGKGTTFIVTLPREAIQEDQRKTSHS
ncbi:MAG: HAMP domain-containing protein [Acidobacteria bacterium]|nr:HAMP domain-containing protein [Acidobacteriota bacterium]